LPNRNLNMRELGDTGLKRYAGLIYEEFLPELISTEKRTRIFKEMSDNDPIVGAILFAIEKLIRQVDWKVKPFSEEEEDVEKANFVNSCMQDMSITWEELISEILSMLTYGWSFFELVYKKRLGLKEDESKSSRFGDGLVGWEKIAIRAQDTLYKWQFGDNGHVVAMAQIQPPNFKIRTIPMEKALLFKTTSQKGNPEGRSILRNSYRPWYFKKNIEEIEGIGIERDLAGLPVAWVPPEILDENASTEEKAIFETVRDIVTNIRRDEQEGIVFPLVHDEQGNKMYDLQLMSTGGSRQFDTSEIVERYDKRIAMSVMADFLLLGQSGTGSFALSNDKTDLFVTALKTWLDSIEAEFNRKAIPKLFKINGFDLERLPKIKAGKIRKINLKDLAEYINTLSGAGATIFPDEDLENYLRRIANLPTENGGGEHKNGMDY